MAGRTVVESALLARGAAVITLLSIVIVDVQLEWIGTGRNVNRYCCCRSR